MEVAIISLIIIMLTNFDVKKILPKFQKSVPSKPFQIPHLQLSKLVSNCPNFTITEARCIIKDQHFNSNDYLEILV